MNEPTKSRFLNDVREHRMTIVQDNGLYRHVRFAKPQSSNWLFNLTTWPGYLAISGDCDDFMFTRLDDMFEFFRGDRINCQYWAEKATAVSKSGGLVSFDEDAYKRAIISDFRGKFYEHRMKAWADVRETLLYYMPSDATEAIGNACSYKDTEGDYPFRDFWDHRLTKPSYGFTWACYAIQWGIKRYDLAKAGQSQADVDRLVLAGKL